MSDFPFPIQAGFHVDFNSADIEFNLSLPDKTIEWLKTIVDLEKGNVAELNFIFCSDGYLHNLNVEYLKHDTLTDIITFPINLDPIQSDIYISINRIQENAKEHNQSFEIELRRVMAHGLLHLLGFGDKTEDEISTMRQKEASAIHLWSKTQ